MSTHPPGPSGPSGEDPRPPGPSGNDPRPPRSLVSRPEEDALADAERMRQAVAALERVRTQLARTQRTLDAFVAQITGTPDGALTLSPGRSAADDSSPVAPAGPPIIEASEPQPVEREQPRASAGDVSSLSPPDALAGHVLPPAVYQPPVVPGHPSAPGAAADPASVAPRPAPPVALTDHVRSAEAADGGAATGRALPPGPDEPPRPAGA